MDAYDLLFFIESGNALYMGVSNDSAEKWTFTRRLNALCMGNQLLVSVIIPNYNHAKYLDERIQSVLNQTYQNFEVIILDDCSSDNGASKAVIEKYRKNPHISHIVYNEVNSGSTFKQWHKGFKFAKGELIWIAESDDKCELNLLEELIKPFKENDNCVLSYCLSIKFDGNGKIMDPKIGTRPNIFIDGKKYIKNYLSEGTSIKNASSALFRKEVALTIDDEYANFRGAGDRLFWVNVAENGDVAIINKQLNLFRQHDSNSTKKYYTSGINQAEDKIILDYILKKRYISKLLYHFRKCQYAQRQILFYKYIDSKKEKEFMKIWELNELHIIFMYLYNSYFKLYRFLYSLYCNSLRNLFHRPL